jgi:four helix bundle protein
MGEPFENSEAWKSARTLTNEVYSLCWREPLSRDFGLRDQLQRVTVSVMNNVAEGWESLHVAEKRQAYNIRPQIVRRSPFHELCVARQ